MRESRPGDCMLHVHGKGENHWGENWCRASVGESWPAGLDSLVLGHAQGIGPVGLLLWATLWALSLGNGPMGLKLANGITGLMLGP